MSLWRSHEPTERALPFVRARRLVERGLSTWDRSDLIRVDPASFADLLTKNEKGEPWSLALYQRRVLEHAFTRTPEGRLPYRLVLWSEPKKSGKTFVAALLLLWWGCVTKHTEIIVASNDLEQAQSRVFRTAVSLIRHNPSIGQFVKVQRSTLHFSNGTVATAISSDYASAAGARHSLVIFDELWGYSLERAERLFEELTPPPSEPDAWQLVVTTAGFSGESRLLESLYQRGVAGARLDDDLELYEADDMFCFWSHVARQRWQSEQYYTEQRRLLRESTYLRLHENRWVTAESGFITPEMWDACVEPSWGPMAPTKVPSAVVAIDAAYKHDTAAAVMVIRDGDQLIVANHRVWRPSASTPLDFEATIEATVLAWARDYRLTQVVADPYQMISTLTRLRARRINAVEFLQTPAELTAMTSTLYDLIVAQSLVAYPDPDLRAHILNAVVVESPRGGRLAKEKASKKIDLAVALAMACAVAIASPVSPEVIAW